MHAVLVSVQVAAPPSFVITHISERLELGAMAERHLTLNEVMDGLEGSDFEDSEDDFDGYLDMDDYATVEEGRDDREEKQSVERIMEESAEIVGETVGAYVEIDSDTGSMDDLDEIPQYLLQAGCSASVENESPLEFFSLPVFLPTIHARHARTHCGSNKPECTEIY